MIDDVLLTLFSFTETGFLWLPLVCLAFTFGCRKWGLRSTIVFIAVEVAAVAWFAFVRKFVDAS